MRIHESAKMSTENHEQHGPPDFKIAGFCVWVFGREFEAAQDYWDGNWLRVLAHCGAQGAVVRASGAILHLSELLEWRDELANLHSSLTGSAQLACTEPNLDASIDLRDGRGTLAVNITPDHMTQQHRFQFDLDQSYLPGLISALERLLQNYPIRGQPGPG
jgi:hypothetical protein